MRLSEARTDYYRKKAREQGYKSRAAFKLLEAVQRYKLIKPGDRVVDLGAAPGGWLQVASESAGESGLVVGFDLSKVDLKLSNVKTLVLDVNDPAVASKALRLLNGHADVLLSDLSPNISGVWELDHFKQVDLVMRSLELGDLLLRRGGNSMIKIFDGERFLEAKRAAEQRFSLIVIMKPKASRLKSSELYLVCLNKRS